MILRPRDEKPSEHHAFIARMGSRARTAYPVRVTCHCGWGPLWCKGEKVASLAWARHVKRRQEVRA